MAARVAADRVAMEVVILVVIPAALKAVAAAVAEAVPAWEAEACYIFKNAFSKLLILHGRQLF